MENSLERMRSKRYYIVLSVALFLFYVVYMLTLDTMGLSLYILRAYAPLVVYVLLGCALYRGSIRLKSTWTVGLLMLLWYILSRIFLGDTFLQRSAVTVADLAVLYALAFPFAQVSGDGNKRRVLDILSLVYVLTMTVIAWMSIYLAVTGKSLTMPQSGYDFAMSTSGRLYMLGQNPNHSAPLLAMALFLALYLLSCYRNKLWLIPGVIVIVGLYGALTLTVSRTAFIAATATFGYLAGCLASKIKVKKLWLKTLVVAAIVLAGMLLAYKSLDWVKELLFLLASTVQRGDLVFLAADRDMTIAVDNMSGRGMIYSAILQVLREEPKVLLFGNLDLDVAAKISEVANYTYQHCHNSFLQVLMLMGLPGLLLVLWICVKLGLSVLKLLFAKDSAMAEKLLALVPVYFLVSSLAESLVFVPWMNLGWSLLNFWFLLISGYIIVAGDRYKLKDVFYKGMFRTE